MLLFDEWVEINARRIPEELRLHAFLYAREKANEGRYGLRKLLEESLILFRKEATATIVGGSIGTLLGSPLEGLAPGFAAGTSDYMIELVQREARLLWSPAWKDFTRQERRMLAALYDIGMKVGTYDDASEAFFSPYLGFARAVPGGLLAIGFIQPESMESSFVTLGITGLVNGFIDHIVHYYQGRKLSHHLGAGIRVIDVPYPRLHD